MHVRICLGRYKLTVPYSKHGDSQVRSRHIANNSLFINIATLLFCMDIEPSKTNPPDINQFYNAGLVVYVPPQAGK